MEIVFRCALLGFHEPMHGSLVTPQSRALAKLFVTFVTFMGPQLAVHCVDVDAKTLLGSKLLVTLFTLVRQYFKMYNFDVKIETRLLSAPFITMRTQLRCQVWMSLLQVDCKG